MQATRCVIFIYRFKKLVYSFFMHFLFQFFVTLAQIQGLIFYVLTFCTNLSTSVLFSLLLHAPCSPIILIFVISDIFSLLFIRGLKTRTSVQKTLFTLRLPSCIIRNYMIYCKQYTHGGHYAFRIIKNHNHRKG